MLEPASQRPTTSTPEDLRDADVVIFDYDGTLYEGTGFVEPYLAILQAAAGEAADDLPEAYRAVIGRAHVLAPGDFYHYGQGVILGVDPVPPYDRFGLRVTGTRHWDGRPAPRPPDVADGHAGFDADLTYVGDHWQVVNAVASAAGIGLARRREALDAIRRYMRAPGYDWGVPPALFAVLEMLRDVPERIVVTNTPREYARAGLVRMGLGSAFTRAEYDSRKPAGLLRVLSGLVDEGVPPSRILCIGDNYWNDIVPAVQAGCRGVLVDTLDLGEPSGAHLRVEGFDRLHELLRDATGHGVRGRPVTTVGTRSRAGPGSARTDDRPPTAGTGRGAEPPPDTSRS